MFFLESVQFIEKEQSFNSTSPSESPNFSKKGPFFVRVGQCATGYTPKKYFDSAFCESILHSYILYTIFESLFLLSPFQNVARVTNLQSIHYLWYKLIWPFLSTVEKPRQLVGANCSGIIELTTGGPAN